MSSIFPVSKFHFPIEPAPDSIARVLEKFRKDIGNNVFSISTHANNRMISRGIDIKEMMATVQRGVFGKGRVIPDYIGGKYIMNDLVVVVYAPFGDRSAIPNVVTVYRQGDEDEYMIEDLPAVEEVKHLKLKVAELSATAASVDSLSIEELEQVLSERRHKQAEEQRAEQMRKESRLRTELEGLQQKIATLTNRLLEIKSELGEE